MIDATGPWPEGEYEVLLEGHATNYIKIKASSPQEAAKLAKEHYAGKQQIETHLEVVAVSLKPNPDEADDLAEIEIWCDNCRRPILRGVKQPDDWPWSYSSWDPDNIRDDRIMCYPCAKQAGHPDAKK